jgi:hypothetical protein
MHKPPAAIARQLEKLRWPLIAAVLLCVVSVARASWIRVSGTFAGEQEHVATADKLATGEEPAAADPPSASPGDEEPGHAAPETAWTPVEPAVAQPAAVEPAAVEPATVEPAVTDPLLVEAPVSDPPSVDPPAKHELVIANPAENRLRVGFALNDEIMWLEAGETKTFTGVGPFSIAWHRGADFDDVRQTLDLRGYRFSVSREEGWELTSDPEIAPAEASPE